MTLKADNKKTDIKKLIAGINNFTKSEVLGDKGIFSTPSKQWKGEIVVAEVEHLMDHLRILFGINKLAPLLKHPDLRKHNEDIVSLAIPYITGVSDGYITWKPGKSKRYAISDTFAANVVADVVIDARLTKGLLPANLVEHMRDLCDKLAYRNPLDAVMNALISGGLKNEVVLSNRRMGPGEMEWMFVKRRDSIAKVREIYERDIKTNQILLDCGVRATRFVEDDFIPCRALILRQFLNIVRGTGDEER